MPITPHVAAQEDLPVDYGVYVDQRRGRTARPTRRASRQGDIILAIDGQRIDQDNPFIEVLFNHEPGETVEVDLQRGDDERTVEVELGERD